jgi:hypothetical protein
MSCCGATSQPTFEGIWASLPSVTDSLNYTKSHQWCVCVCVCVCEKERERERENDDQLKWVVLAMKLEV